MVTDRRPSILGRYRVLGTIATAPSRQVLLAEDLRHGGRRAALKLSLLSGPRAYEVAHREFEVLRRLRHPGLAEVFDFGRLGPRELEGTGVHLGDASAPRSDGPSQTGANGHTGEAAAGGAAPRFTEATPEAWSMAYLASVYYEGLHLRQAFLRLFGPRSSPWRSSRRGGGGDPSRPGRRWRVFLEALAAICEALDAVHASGLIHYDIKPENLLLIPSPQSGVPTSFDVKILDFGLSEADTTPLGTGLRGTVPFLAPELLQNGTADRRSDLFSLGVTIAYAVSGRFPFRGDTPKRWLASARTGHLLDLRELCPHAPPGLLDLVARLCHPDPEERPPDALAVMAHLERVGRFTLVPRRSVPGRAVPRTTWAQEISFLQGEFEKLKRGDVEKPLILIEAQSGQFPGQLIEEVEALAKKDGITAHTGACCLPRRYPREPFAEIVAKVAIDVDLTSARYARFLPFLAEFAPGASAAGEPLPPLPPRLDLSRSIDITTEFFLDLARHTPLVLCFRDLHLAGRESLDLVRSLARNVALSSQEREDLVGTDTVDPPRLLLVATFSDTEGERSAERDLRPNLDLIRELSAQPWTTRLRLEDLPLERVSEWLRERAPQLRLAGETVRRLHEQSRGVPRLLDEFVRRLLGEGREGRGKRIEVDPGVLLNLPHKGEDSILLRVAALSPADRHWITLLAAAHRPLPLKELGTIKSGDATEGRGSAPGSREPLLARMKRLEEEGLVEVRQGFDDAEASLPCPLLAEQVYQQIPEDQRLEMHGRLAAAIAEHARAAPPSRTPEDVAFHAALAGSAQLFIDHALLAASRLQAAHAPEAATHLYEAILDRLGPPRPENDGLRRLANERLADLYEEQGQLQRALEKLTVLSSLVEGTDQVVDRAAVYRRMGEVCRLSGEFSNASYFLERGLKLLRQALAEGASPAAGAAGAAGAGRAADARAVSELLETLMELARHHLARAELDQAESVLRECLAAGEADPHHRRALVSANVLSSEVESPRTPHADGPAPAFKALSLAEEEGDLALIFEALGALGSDHTAHGLYDKAAACFERGLVVAAKLRSTHQLAVCHSSLGEVYYSRGDHQRALEHYRKSLQLKQRLGDLRGIAKGYNNLGLVYQVRDDLTRASECYKRSIDLFSRTNDQHGMAAGMNNLSSVLEIEGKYNEALDYSFRALDKRKKLHSHAGMAFCYYRIGRIYQSRGENDKALSYAEKGLQVRMELGEKLGTGYSRLQMAEIHLAQGKYQDALHLATQGLKDFESIENDVGQVMARETLARVLFVLGELEEAREILSRAIERSSKLEQRTLEASCLLQLGKIALEQGEVYESEHRFLEAERLFRVNRSRRDLAATLLERSGLEVARNRPRKAAALLEEAYSMLEQMGIRDLVPIYFLLRGQMELQTPGGSVDAARKYLERGLVEARDLHLPDALWRLQLRLGVLEARSADAKLARIHFQEAQDVLEDALSGLPPHSREAAHRLRERQELGLCLAGAVAGPEASSPAPAPPAAPPAGVPEERADRSEELLSLHRQTLKLHDIAAAVGSERDLQKLLEHIMDSVLEFVDAERGFLLLKDPADDGTTITVARNLDRQQILEPEQKVSDSVASEVLRTGRPVLSGNALSEERFLASKSIHNLRLRSLVCVPLRFQGMILGVVYLDNRHLRDAFRQEDLHLLQAFADQAAAAVAYARLMEEHEKRNEELVEANRQMEILNLKLRRKVHQRSAELAIVRADLRNRQDQLEDRYRFQNIIGKSDSMQQIFALLERISRTALPVLIQGESGTGKELLARAVHFNSAHKEGRFVSENCGALTESLLENELFGHVKGAFTGAVADQKGLFEMASGGTLFLDEVASMSLAMQQKLLRVIEEGTVRRVGGKERIPVSVRIVSASNCDLQLLVDRGEFRKDLYFRLNGIQIRVPSLRERKEDIPLLVESFLEEVAARSGESRRVFPPATMRRLMEYDWPGNVRELRHFVEKTVLTAAGEVIQPDELRFEPAPTRSVPGEEAVEPDGEGEWGSLSLRAARDDFERRFLLRRLGDAGGNVSLAARTCGVSRETFYRLLRKYGLERD
jgi:transcriptional regulator with GAF, ATPase, and Fis domain/serine/threonine protein kinase